MTAAEYFHVPSTTNVCPYNTEWAGPTRHLTNQGATQPTQVLLNNLLRKKAACMPNYKVC